MKPLVTDDLMSGAEGLDLMIAQALASMPRVTDHDLTIGPLFGSDPVEYRALMVVTIDDDHDLMTVMRGLTRTAAIRAVLTETVSLYRDHLSE